MDNTSINGADKTRSEQTDLSEGVAALCGREHGNRLGRAEV